MFPDVSCAAMVELCQEALEKNYLEATRWAPGIATLYVQFFNASFPIQPCRYAGDFGLRLQEVGAIAMTSAAMMAMVW